MPYDVLISERQQEKWLRIFGLFISTNKISAILRYVMLAEVSMTLT